MYDVDCNTNQGAEDEEHHESSANDSPTIYVTVSDRRHGNQA